MEHELSFLIAVLQTLQLALLISLGFMVSLGLMAVLSDVAPDAYSWLDDWVMRALSLAVILFAFVSAAFLLAV